MNKEQKLKQRIKRLEEALVIFASLPLCKHEENEEEGKSPPEYSCKEICERDKLVMWVYAGKDGGIKHHFTTKDVLLARKLLKYIR